MKTPLALLVVAAFSLAACSSGPGASTRSDPLSANGVNATLRIQSDWKSGYCADVTLQNTGSAPVTSWTVVIDLHHSAVTNLWNGNVAASGSQITVTPSGAWNSAIAPGASLGAFGFCANATGSPYLPELISIATAGGGGGAADFALAASPASLSVTRGASASAAISISRSNLPDSVALSASGLPAGVTATFSPASTTGTSSTLTLAASAAAATGSATVTVSGTGGGLTRTVQLALAVSDAPAADTTAPSAPGAPTATATTSSSVTLAWAASTDNVGVAGYDVYRGAALAASATTTSATVTGLAAGASYTFTVRARDAAGNVSPPSPSLTVTTQGSGGAAALKVQYRPSAPAASTNQLTPVIDVVNTGTAAVAMSELTVRYWYTEDGSQAQVYSCDYTPRGCGNVTARFVKLAAPVSGADGYLEIGFTSAAGTLAPGQSFGAIQNRFAKSDYTNFDQTNDYSYDPTKSALAD